MAFTPDLPFPKGAGDPIRSKDWNDHVNETKRLDVAKVERAGDAITGPLSVAGALAVGKASAAATAKLDVAGDLRINDSNLLLRGGTDPNHGLGWFGNPSKLFAGTNVDGPVLWGNLGGGLGSGTDAAQRLALRWDNNGKVMIGVASTELRVDIGSRIRLRQGADESAGLWLFQTTPNADRAFIGMANDNEVGFWGNGGLGWGLRMNVNTGQITSPRFRVSRVFYFSGPLPRSASFTCGGGPLLIMVAGSAFRTGAGGPLGFLVQIDGNTVINALGYSNEVGSHKAIPPLFHIQTGVAAGSHTLGFVVGTTGVLTDGNDFFNATVLELPF